MGKRQLILVAGHPKSGTTWLARLLGDALNSPVGAGLPSHNAKEVATEGQDRPGQYAIRKAHFRLVDKRGGKAIVAPHKLSWRNLTTEKVIFIVRDPRDVAVSKSHYWKRPLATCVSGVATGWNAYVISWLTADFEYSLIRYEDLLEDTLTALWALLTRVGIEFDDARLGPAVERQSFEARKVWTEQHGDTLPHGRAFHLRFLRKGIAGDWRNELTPEMQATIEGGCREGMRRLGYD